jgi:hypothetical protein
MLPSASKLTFSDDRALRRGGLSLTWKVAVGLKLSHEHRHLPEHLRGKGTGMEVTAAFGALFWLTLALMVGRVIVSLSWLA